MSASVPKTILVAAAAALLSAALQASPAFLPVIGYPLSLLSTLPILIAAMCSAGCGWLAFAAACAALAVLAPGQALVFLCVTGSFGLALGVYLPRSPALAVLFSAGGLMAGLLLLIYLAKAFPFSLLAGSVPLYLLMLLLACFCAGYALLWARVGVGLLKALPFLRL